MHTPDGFITSWVCVMLLAVAIGAFVNAAFSVRKWLTKEKALLMAALAAVIFAFQMLNFPIGYGTSGHLIGASLAAILLGPSAAVIILAVVLLVQAFVYGDGGITTIGVNIFNMGIVAAYTAYYTYKPLKNKLPSLAPIIASWVSVVAASLFCAIELGISGTVPMLKAIPAMAITHALIGIGEGLITSGILLYVQKTRHELLMPTKTTRGISRYIVLSTLLAVLIMSFALPFASPSPDGLENVAIRLGFYEKAATIYTLAPMQGYSFLGQESYLFVLAAAITGIFVTFLLGYIIALPLARKT